MRVLWMANLINIILDPCLIFGWGFFPELGLKGAAIVTSIGRGLAVMTLFALLFIITPGFFMQLFIDIPTVIDAGSASLRILSYGLVLYGLGMVVIQAFNGAGDTITPTRINLFCFWLMEIPLSYILALTMGMKEHGVYIAIITSESIMTLIGVYLFRKGKWKLKEV